MLAAWMLAMVTVSCSNDENYVEESIKVIGERRLPMSR